MQKGFARYKQTQKLAKDIADLLEKNLFDIVIATRFLNQNDSIYERLLDWHRLKDRGEQQLDEKIQKHIDIVVDKNIYNCVNETFIQKLFSLNDGIKPKQIFVVGADTDC